MRCVVHIGAQTTATVTFHEWLYLNRARLLEQGVALSNICGRHNCNRLLAYLNEEPRQPFFRNHSIFTQEERDAFREEFVRDFSQEARRFGRQQKAHTVIFSGRQLHSQVTQPAEIEEFSRLLSATFDEVRLYCSVREQSQMALSLYSRAVRNGYTGTLKVFGERVTPENLLFNHHATLTRWAGAFGRDALDVAVFDERAGRGEAMCRRQLERMVPGVVCDAFEALGDERGVRLAPLPVAVIRAHNEMLVGCEDVAPARTAVVHAVRAFGPLQTPRVPHPDAECIRAMFAPSNRALADDFLGGVDEPFGVSGPLSAAQRARLDATIEGLAGAGDVDVLRRVAAVDEAAQTLSGPAAEALVACLNARADGKGRFDKALALVDERRSALSSRMASLRARAREEQRDVTVEDLLGQLSADPDKQRKRREGKTAAAHRFIVYFTPRSGSSWLNTAMNQAGVFGIGGELFNFHYVENLARNFGVNSLDAFCDTVLRTHKTDNDVFTSQVTYFHLKRIADQDLFYRYFPPRSPAVYLMRENIVLQAISLYKATETKVFHSATHSEADIENARRFDAYDGEKIMRWVNHIHEQEDGFERHFRRWQIEPLRLSYERMFADEARVLPAIADWFGVALPAAADGADNPHRAIAGATNATIEQRFRSEYAVEIARIENRRRVMLKRLDGKAPTVHERVGVWLRERLSRHSVA